MPLSKILVNPCPKCISCQITVYFAYAMARFNWDDWGNWSLAWLPGMALYFANIKGEGVPCEFMS